MKNNSWIEWWNNSSLDFQNKLTLLLLAINQGDSMAKDLLDIIDKQEDATDEA
tara:strand:+ start:1299 stop:1457 length:159 start_codon:yes stop_codon:yes gene_type:complete